jgi:hypothetical protein
MIINCSLKAPQAHRRDPTYSIFLQSSSPAYIWSTPTPPNHTPPNTHDSRNVRESGGAFHLYHVRLVGRGHLCSPGRESHSGSSHLHRSVSRQDSNGVSVQVRVTARFHIRQESAVGHGLWPGFVSHCQHQKTSHNECECPIIARTCISAWLSVLSLGQDQRYDTPRGLHARAFARTHDLVECFCLLLHIQDRPSEE